VFADFVPRWFTRAAAEVVHSWSCGRHIIEKIEQGLLENRQDVGGKVHVRSLMCSQAATRLRVEEEEESDGG